MPYQNKFKILWAPSCVVFVLLLAGCHSSLWSSKNINGKAEPALTSPFASTAPTNAIAADEAAANTALAGEQDASSSTPKPAATPQEIMADVRELGKVNPAAQAALMKELEKVEPDLWPSVVRNFRSRLAYGDRMYQEEMLAAKGKQENGGQDPRYANQNPYYAGQPIPDNGTSAPSTGLQPGFYPAANNPAAGMPQPYPPQQPTGYPQPGYPTYPQPNMSPGQPTTPYPYTPYSSSKPTDGGVIPASYEEEYNTDERSAVKQVVDSMNPETEPAADMKAPEPLDWEDSLAASIEALRAKLEAAEDGDADSTLSDAELRADQLRLRFMLLAAGRGTEAVEPVEGMSEAMTDFWAGQMFGMNDLLDERKASNPSLRNASAKRKLSEAIQHLGKVASLEVRNLSFCKAVNGFASIEQFPKYEFKAGSQVILYAELDNLKHEESAEGYRTSLEIGYEIFDSTDRRVEPAQPTASEECSTILRRDYYVSQLIRLPENLYPGQYVLKLKVEDRLGQKYGESIIDFEVK